MNLGLSLSPNQIQTLQQILSPSIIQLLKTFHMPYTDLLKEADQLSKENVFVDVQQYDQLSQYAYSLTQNTKSFDTDMGFDFTDHHSASKSETLYEFLHSQLKLLHLKERDYQISNAIIQSLDTRGYINDYATLKQQLVQQFQVKERTISDILTTIVHSLEPDGIAARSLKDCLLIQIDHYNFQDESLRALLHTLVKHHLNDLSEKNHESIAQALDIKEEGVQALVTFIKENLNPNPGSAFSNHSLATMAIPSFDIYLDNDKLVLVNLEKEKGIKLGFSKQYLDLLQDPNTDDKTKAFLKEKYQKAKTFIDNMTKRHENLDTMFRHICHHQLDFIRKGPIYLTPLLQKEVSEALDIGASTVSRIVSSKFIRTPHGVFSLHQLCPRRHFGKTSLRLQLMITDLIKENPSLSDLKLSRHLKEKGIPIARRTVTKYRHLCNIPTKPKRNLLP